jgi:hypothetical protein
VKYSEATTANANRIFSTTVSMPASNSRSW